MILKRVIQAVRWRLRHVYERRYFLLSKIIRPNVPQHNLTYLPDGFSISTVDCTGVSIIDNFCTQEEAQEIIDFAKERVRPASVLVDGKFVKSTGRISDTLRVFGPGNPDPQFMPMACRAAALTGLPYTHLEGVYVTRYKEGGFYNEHLDSGDDFKVDRLYTVLLYLNDMDAAEGGSTAFPRLNIEVQPKAGRAVSWTNKNPDGSMHMEVSHAALPVNSGAEKWTIQFWFHPYKMFNELDIKPPQAVTGTPIDENYPLPEGARFFVRGETK